MNNSSSSHTLNADKGLGFLQKLLYLGANALNAIVPDISRHSRLQVKPFRPTVTREEWLSIDEKASMGRKWSNLFWMHLPWNALASAAGPLHILDMGCGPGGYGPRFLKWGGTSVVSYLGIEPSSKHAARWHDLVSGDVRLKYVQGSADDIDVFLDDSVNMFVSQSSLEHIEEDLLLFRRVAQSLRLHPRKLVQVHLVPAGTALPLYQFHGVRQYTPRTIQSIVRLFPDASVDVYALGGSASWRLQWRSFALPMLLRRKNPPDSGYPERSWQAFSTDVRRGRSLPIFYAIIIRSGLLGE